jgi:hypothetical protein
MIRHADRWSSLNVVGWVLIAGVGLLTGVVARAGWNRLLVWLTRRAPLLRRNGRDGDHFGGENA